jgi:hypothetical protein
LELTEEENCKKYIFSNAIDENCEDLNVSRRGMTHDDGTTDVRSRNYILFHFFSGDMGLTASMLY